MEESLSPLPKEGERGLPKASSRPLAWVMGGVLLAFGGFILFVLHLMADTPRPEVVLAGYATSLEGRTPAQRYNAKRAADALNGVVIPPGGIFSFNTIVKSWTWEQGYVKAPVSYDGELVPAFGGGVCQTSTTLYNSALLAGLPIIERHHHVFAPHYVTPGRDAAVAQYDIDLRFKNPYSWAIRLRTEVHANLLEISVLGVEKPKTEVRILTDILSQENPARLTRVIHPQYTPRKKFFVRNPGAVGYRVVSYRVFVEEGREVRRERLSDDSYQPMDRVIQYHEEA
ncbi:MAG: VanW family protein [Armatimonadetes bacterium]|nr:VanW family protein [Armatimonadota bacterium]